MLKNRVPADDTRDADGNGDDIFFSVFDECVDKDDLQ